MRGSRRREWSRGEGGSVGNFEAIGNKFVGATLQAISEVMSGKEGIQIIVKVSPRRVAPTIP